MMGGLGNLGGAVGGMFGQQATQREEAAAGIMCVCVCVCLCVRVYM